MMNLLKRIAIAGVIASVCTAADAQTLRGITNVKGDVYRAQSQYHYSFVVVTSDGVVVVDPINDGAAHWLKENIKQITDKPITHLIYSHSHGDHASGGSLLGATTVIAHENAPEDIHGVKPTIRIGAEKTFEIGGKTFELTWLGAGHGEDMIAVVVRPENVGFIVDVVSPKRLPYQTMPSSSVDAWIEQVKKTDTLDFEILAPGHGQVGVKADVRDVQTYMETLRAEVLAGLKAGKTPQELQDTVTMADYKDWGQFGSWRSMNVEGMANYLIKADKVK